MSYTSYKAGDGCNYRVCNIYFEESNNERIGKTKIIIELT